MDVCWGRRLTGGSGAFPPPPPSTRIMQSISVAPGYIPENIPIWLRLTAFEERERRRRYGEHRSFFRCYLLHVGGHTITGRASLCLLLSSDRTSASGSSGRDDSWSSGSVFTDAIGRLTWQSWTFSSIHKRLWTLSTGVQRGPGKGRVRSQRS